MSARRAGGQAHAAMGPDRDASVVDARTSRRGGAPPAEPRRATGPRCTTPRRERGRSPRSRGSLRRRTAPPSGRGRSACWTAATSTLSVAVVGWCHGRWAEVRRRPTCRSPPSRTRCRRWTSPPTRTASCAPPRRTRDEETQQGAAVAAAGRVRQHRRGDPLGQCRRRLGPGRRGPRRSPPQAPEPRRRRTAALETRGTQRVFRKPSAVLQGVFRNACESVVARATQHDTQATRT